MAQGVINITHVGNDHYMLVKLPKMKEKMQLNPADVKVPMTIKVQLGRAGGNPIAICCDGACCNGLKNSDWGGMRITGV